MQRSLPVLTAVALLALAACDSAELDDPADAPVGRWSARVALDLDTTWVLTDVASTDSVRYTYLGTQTVTLDLRDADALVAGTVTLDERGVQTETFYKGGTARRDFTPVDYEATEAVGARFGTSTGTLTFDPFSEPVLDRQLAGLKVRFQDGTGTASVKWQPPTSVGFTRTDGVVVETSLAGRATATFRRVGSPN